MFALSAGTRPDTPPLASPSTLPCMTVRQGDEMTSFDIASLRRLFVTDPEGAVGAAIKGSMTHQLLDSLLERPILEMSWYNVLRLAEKRSVDSYGWFQRIAQTASNVSLERQELGIALLQCIERYNDGSMPFLEHALNAGVFDSVIRGISRASVLRVDGPMRTTFMTVMFAHVIQRAIKHWNLEDAYKELVASARAFKDERPHAFTVWVERVWREYRSRFQVQALTKEDWRSTTEKRAVRYGDSFSGGEPCVRTEIVNVPEEWLWGPYTQPLGFPHPSADWTPEERAKASEVTVDGQTYTFLVDETGAMLRDLIHYRDRIKKERKLKQFCEHHGLKYPTP